MSYPTPINRSLPALITPDCTTLVLGSMPSVVSLAGEAYYAHPRNLFWDIAATLFQISRDLPYEVRVARLLAQHIGLWDVLKTANRTGSSDASIRNAVPNDFLALLVTYPQLRHICLNGAAAGRFWQRLVLPSLCAGLDAPRLREIMVTPLPSTSPANASMPRKAKFAQWRDALLMSTGRLAF